MILWYDYETFYDSRNGYSLRKMTRTEYLNDPRFQAHGCAVALDDSPFEWIDGCDLPGFFADVRKHVTHAAAHNALFDSGITAKFYCPDRWFQMCTQSMAQGALQHRYPGQRVSLAKLAQFYWPDQPELWKEEGVLQLVDGLRTEEISPGLMQRMIKYAKQDGHVMRELWKRLLKEDYPWATALHDISITIAMGVYPQMVMNTEKAATINRMETEAKEQAAASMGIGREELRSNARLAELFRSCGVEPPTKKNPKGEQIYAFAATDEGFKELAEHPDARVRALVDLRLGEKAAQQMTRSARFAKLPRMVPCPLKYAAAHTGRHGGSEFNLQNMEREGDLRECIEAPEGHKIVAADSSQIELRLNMWFAGQDDVLEILRNGGDIYSQLASKIFGYPVDKSKYEERFTGKLGELSCGYGAGAAKVTGIFKQKRVPNADEAMGKLVVRTYRKERNKVVAMWAWLNDVALPALAGITPEVEHKGCKFMKGRVLLPSGRSLWYNDLQMSIDGDWTYQAATSKGVIYRKHIWGGALDENLIQALAYDVFMFHERQLNALRPSAMVIHDEHVFVVPNQEVPLFTAQAKQILSIGPDWLGNCPLDAEVGDGDNYAQAK